MAVQAEARSSELYEQDSYAWAEVQADLLRRRRFAALDLEQLPSGSRTWAAACTARSVRASERSWSTC